MFTSTPDPILAATGITKTFFTTSPPAQVLKGIDLSVRPGEFVAIMGASGSGKSTLLYAVSEMDRPTDGRVEFNGRDLTSLNDTELAHMRLQGMGFVFQQPHFLDNLSVRDNILLPAVKSGLFAGSEADKRVDDLLARFGIDHIADHAITRVSGGQLQRAAICRALVNHPPIIFADEPTGALNSRMTEEVLNEFSDIHRSGTAIVMVTHAPTVAMRADRIVYLHDGLILSQISLPAWSSETNIPSRQERVLDWLAEKGF